MKAWDPLARRMSKACSRGPKLIDHPMMRMVTGSSPKFPSCGPSGDRGALGTGAGAEAEAEAEAGAFLLRGLGLFSCGGFS